MHTADFDYHLPDELIARHPAVRRDESRLLVMPREGDLALQHLHFSNLPDLLRSGDLLVVNDSRVIPARLMARRAGSGGTIEILLLEEKEPLVWLAMVRPGKKVMIGERLIIAPRELEAEVLAFGQTGERVLRFETALPWNESLEKFGHTPLPPYILKARQLDQGKKILEEQDDRQRYQTVYAGSEGASVAAPTAGLHFTPELLERCMQKSIALARVELEVGAGTFLPVKTEDVENHQMHTEHFRVSEEAAQQILQTKKNGGRVIAVGTTVIRVLETLAHSEEGIRPCVGTTNIFILPGFAFKAVDALITNFHFPRSTLLMLVSAFAGRERILTAYEEAVRQQYRFYSYGDAMLIQ